jgi:hypothetical protein
MPSELEIAFQKRKDRQAQSNASINRVDQNRNNQDIRNLRQMNNNKIIGSREYLNEPYENTPYEPPEVTAEIIETSPTVINVDSVAPLLYKAKDPKKRFIPTFISNSTKRNLGSYFNKPRWGMTTQQSNALPSELNNNDIIYDYNVGGITRKSRIRKSKQSKRRKSKKSKRRKSKKSKRRN